MPTSPHTWTCLGSMERHRLRHDREEAGSILYSKNSAPSTYSNYNWTLGLIFGRRMVHDAEQQDHLNESQWGSRPGRSTEEALIHKILSYEISRLTRTPLGTLDNDAKACYDRIIMLFALLLCQKHGVPLSACKLSAKALIAAKYAIKTGFGISKVTYSSTIDQPTHGPGQGSRQASALWMVVSCLLFTAMYEQCHGVSFAIRK
jgi:hypothetical protein